MRIAGFMINQELPLGSISINDIPEELMVEEGGLDRAKWIFQRIPEDHLEGIREDILDFMRSGKGSAELS
jgi:hypothetical protein